MAFKACFVRFMRRFAEGLQGVVAVDGKSNEITAVPKLLELLSLNGCIVTADALNCQRAIAAKVIEQGANYVLALKGNQGTLHDDVRRFFNDPGRQHHG